MRMRTCVALMVLLTLTASASFAQKIYWADAAVNAILRGDRDGVGTPEILFNNPTDGVSGPVGVSVDVSAGKIYWTDQTTQKIRRGNLDGTGAPEDLFDNPTDGVVRPEVLILDVVAGKIYWADFTTAKIRRGNMDGTGSAEDLFDGTTDGVVAPVGIALDIAAGKVYWTDNSTRKVQRGNTDGTGAAEDLFDATDGLLALSGMALDVGAGKVYWVDNATDKIQRGNMDGTGSPEDLFDGTTDGLTGPTDIALDIPAGKAYWADAGTVKIQRGNMDGTGPPEDLFDATDGLIILRGITLDFGAADTTAPVVTVTPLTTSDSRPPLMGNIDDPGATVSVTVDGQVNAATNNGSTWSLADNVLLTLPAGTYDVQVTATDAASNVGTDATTNELIIQSSGSGGGQITSNLTPEQMIEGARLELTAPGGFTDYRWKKDGAPMADGGNISGTATQVLVIDPLSLVADSGVYTVQYEDGIARAVIETDGFVVVVLAAVALPAASWWALLATLVSLLVVAAALRRRRRASASTK